MVELGKYQRGVPKYGHQGRSDVVCRWERSFFFWTMLRSSLQQWQSWSCAKVVIVRQLNQNDWPVTSNKEKPQRQQTKTTPNNHTGTKRNHMFLTNQWKGETGETGSRSHYLVAENLYTNPGSHNLFSILYLIMPGHFLNGLFTLQSASK